MPLAIRLPHHPGVLEADGPYPRALNLLSRKQTAVQRQLRRSGLAGYEPVTQATLMALAEQAPPGSAVYDVGAHIGLYAALIDAVYGRRLTVHAFEPTPDTARVCGDIRRHNGLRFELITSAVSDTLGTAELCLSLKGESSNSLNAAHRRHTETVTVPVTTLDAFTEQRSLSPHLIKIDVETLEGQVLAGALRTARRHRPWIVLEILPGSDHGTLGRALDAFTELGYGLHLLQPESPWPGRTRGDYRTHVGSQCRDWLLTPAPLTYDFHHAVRTWLRAILACDERTNLIVPAGTPFPRGWNAPYPSTPVDEAHDRAPWNQPRPGRVPART
jgi:FkbM family methyltransferase